MKLSSTRILIRTRLCRIFQSFHLHPNRWSDRAVITVATVVGTGMGVSEAAAAATAATAAMAAVVVAGLRTWIIDHSNCSFSFNTRTSSHGQRRIIATIIATATPLIVIIAVA